MESNIFLEHLGVNRTALDPTNQSFDMASDLIYSMNRSEFDTIHDTGNPFDQPFVKALLILLYTAVFILSFFGNLAVVLVTTLHWRMRKTATFCLFNLAIANLCVGIFCVYQNLSLFLIESWIFGNFMCKMYFFIMSLSYTASILILVVIAIERYVVIMHPFEGRRLMTIGKLQIIIIVVWILSAVICFHRFYSVSTSENSLPGGGVEIICSPNVLLHNHKAVDLANFLLLFLLPLFVISILYTRVGLYLKRHSLRFRSVNVTPTITRSPTEMETLDRVLRDLTPPAARRRSSVKMGFVPVPAQGRENTEVGGGTAGSSTYCSRCNSSKQGSPGSRPVITRSLKRSQSWTESNGRANMFSTGTYLSGNDGLPATCWIHEVKSNGLLTPGMDFKEGPQQHRRLNSSDLVLNNRESENCEFCSGDRSSVADRRDSSTDSDPSQNDYRSNSVEMSSNRTLLQTREMENHVELIRLNFSRRRNHISSNNNSPGFLCFRRGTQNLNQLRQPNANHKAVIRMLVVIVSTFALCNFPFHLRKMCQNYFAPCYLDHPLFDLVTPATFLTMYTNCAINPFIYAFMHRRFRVCLVELLSRRCRRIKRRH